MEIESCLFFKNGCSLGYFNGNPLKINCFFCIKGGYNTLEEKEKKEKKTLQLIIERGNGKPRKSCCGGSIKPFST